MPVPVFRVYPPVTHTLIQLVDLGGDAESDPECYLIDNRNITPIDREMLSGVSDLRRPEELQFLFLRLNHDDLWESYLAQYPRLLECWKPRGMTVEELENLPESVIHIYFVRYHRKE